MSAVFIEDEELRGIDYSFNALKKGDYENCLFFNCNFANSDLSSINFSECSFENCDFSLAKIFNTSFQDIKFKNCKLLGLHFEDCNVFLFTVNFENSRLNLSSFYKRNLKNTIFRNCSLHEVDFIESNLASSVFDNCDLSGAIFENTNLEKSDFRTAYNFSINPEINQLRQAKFSREGLGGLLHKYNIEIE